jgi:hypothetical protein
MCNDRAKWIGGVALMLVGGVLLQLACGAYFPNRLLVEGDAVLARMCGQDFATLIKPMRPERFGSLVSFPAGVDYTPSDELRDDFSDLLKLGILREDQMPKAGDSDPCVECMDDPYATLPEDVRARIPEEFQLSVQGRRLVQADDVAGARACFERLLALPVEQRRHRTLRACFMMGRSWQKEDPAKAIEWFHRTRDEAARGFVDTLGLPLASIGWEARAELDRKHMDRAIRLYLEHWRAGDTTAETSLKWSVDRITRGDDAMLDAVARDPIARRLVNLCLGSYKRSEWVEWSDSGQQSAAGPFAARWSEALQRAGVQQVEEAGLIAWYAYATGQYELAGRWAALAAPGSAEARWVRSRLLARDGKLDEAAESLRAMIGDLPASWEWREPSMVSEEPGTRSARANASGERGVLLLTTRHYQEAMDAFLQGDFWEDAAWIGERVLSPEEFEAYLKKRVATEREADREGNKALAYVLARRLARLGQYKRALAYMPEERQASLRRLDEQLSKGQDKRVSQARRASALWEAAKMTRAEGLDLLGTEFGPDFFAFDGQFEQGEKGSPKARENATGVLKPSADERARVQASASSPDLRFHYRYRACELAWQAAELMPDQSSETAAVLCEAGRWLAARDPNAADRFYKALVGRCGATSLGKQAAQVKWFPAKEDKAH